MLTKQELELSDAEKMLDAAQVLAEANGWCVSIAVVDDGGFPLAFKRLPGATRSSIQIAFDKARSCALTGRPTSFFEEMVAKGRVGALSLSGVIPMAGGLPITKGKSLLGGIAASGVASEFDVQVSEAGIAAIDVQ
jgi:glc operon protein GlcG